MQSGVQPAGAPPGSTGNAGGISAAVLGAVGSVVAHIEALFSLFQHETGEAARLYARLGLLFMAAILAAAFGYVLVLVFLAFLCAEVFGIPWIWITLCLALFHLCVAGVCLWLARIAFETPVFAATRAEIRRDVAALRGESGSGPQPPPSI